MPSARASDTSATRTAQHLTSRDALAALSVTMAAGQELGPSSATGWWTRVYACEPSDVRFANNSSFEGRQAAWCQRGLERTIVNSSSVAK
jgi:hypothetical protein